MRHADWQRRASCRSSFLFGFFFSRFLPDRYFSISQFTITVRRTNAPVCTLWCNACALTCVILLRGEFAGSGWFCLVLDMSWWRRRRYNSIIQARTSVHQHPSETTSAQRIEHISRRTRSEMCSFCTIDRHIQYEDCMCIHCAQQCDTPKSALNFIYIIAST